MINHHHGLKASRSRHKWLPLHLLQCLQHHKVSHHLRDRTKQPTSTVAQPSIAVIPPDEESITHDSAQPPANHAQAKLQSLQQDGSENMDTQFQYHQLKNSGNNQPSSTVTQASIQANQPADDNSSLTSVRQPDSSQLLQSTDVQQPADMSASLNDQQGDNQPSSTI